MTATVPVAVVWGLTAAISYGVADFLCAKASKASGALTTAFSVSVIGCLASVVFWPATGHALQTITAGALAAAVAGGALIAAGSALLFKAFAIGPVSIVSPIGAAYPLVTTVVGVLFLGVSLSSRQSAGIVLVVLGVMTAAGLLTARLANARLEHGPALSLATAVLWGLAYPLLDRAVSLSGWPSVVTVQAFVAAAVTGLFLWLSRATEPVTMATIGATLRSTPVVAGAVVLLLGTVAVNVGLSGEDAAGALVAAPSACYPVITVALALRHFREGVDRLALTGAAVAIGGLALISS